MGTHPSGAYPYFSQEVNVMLRIARLILVAMVATLVFGAFGAHSVPSATAQDEIWEVFRVEVSYDGILYVEYVDETNWHVLVREDGKVVYQALGEGAFAWSAISGMVLVAGRNELSYYTFEDLADAPLGSVVYPIHTSGGSFRVWEQPFSDGSFLILDRNHQVWNHVRISRGTRISSLVGDDDLYPISIRGNELGYMLGSDVMIYNAILMETRRSPAAWPVFEEAGFEVSDLGNSNVKTTVEHYRVIRETQRWKLITGIVDGQLKSGVIYVGPMISYFLELNDNPMTLERLSTISGNNLILAGPGREVYDCQIEQYGINCEPVTIGMLTSAP